MDVHVLALRADADASARPGRFNLRRDWSSLLSLVGRHLVWPQPVLARAARLPETSAARAMTQWKGHAELLSDEAFIVQRHGALARSV